MPHKRLLVTENLDPNGPLPRWISPALRRIGWDCWTLPTQEAVQMFGASFYVTMLLKVVAELRPHVLLVKPPYDQLSVEACRRIRECGTRIIGLGIEDSRFVHGWDAKVFTDFQARFDLWLSCAFDGATIQGGARPILWTMAPESVEIDDPLAPAFDVLLLGGCTPPREQLAHAIADGAYNIACFGQGWAAGSLTRPSRLGLMRRAKRIIIPSDGPNTTPILMTEAALLGVDQIVEWTPGLERYWQNAAGPPVYHNNAECIALLQQSQPQSNQKSVWTRVPRWETVWPQIIEGLKLAKQPERSASATLHVLYAALARYLGEQGRQLAAQATLEAWQDSSPNDVSPKIQLARYAALARNWELVLQLIDEARQTTEAEIPPANHNLHSCLNDPRFGPVEPLDASLEILTLELRAFVHLDKADKALELVHSLSAARRQALCILLVPSYDHSAFTALFAALGSNT